MPNIVFILQMSCSHPFQVNEIHFQRSNSFNNQNTFRSVQQYTFTLYPNYETHKDIHTYINIYLCICVIIKDLLNKLWKILVVCFLFASVGLCGSVLFTLWSALDCLPDKGRGEYNEYTWYIVRTLWIFNLLKHQYTDANDHETRS